MLIPIEGAGNALFQCHFWFHVQDVLQFFIAQNGALDVSGAEWGVLHFCLVSLLPVRINGSGRWCLFQFLSICWLCGIRWEQCLYDNRCDISGIDEVPYLISIATDSMDDCRDMMPRKEQVEHSTIPAMNQSLPVRLMRNLTAGALVYIRYMVVMLCAYISFRYLRT